MKLICLFLDWVVDQKVDEIESRVYRVVAVAVESDRRLERRRGGKGPRLMKELKEFSGEGQ